MLGIALGLFATLLACWLKSRSARIVGLSLLVLCSAMACPVFWLGDEGYRNIRPIADEQGQAWLDIHMDRAEASIWVYYILTVLAGAAIVVPRYRPRSEKGLLISTVAMACAVLGVGAWISAAGGRVRHPEFRPAEPLIIQDESEAYEVE